MPIDLSAEANIPDEPLTPPKPAKKTGAKDANMWAGKC
jgi:hypothetical protein